MPASIRTISRREDEQVVLECVEMTGEFEDIREYALMKGNLLTGYIQDTAYQFETVGGQVFAYTAEEVDCTKKRLYELETAYQDRKLFRCSKPVLVNLMQIRPSAPPWIPGFSPE